jgi:hypothetical protein
LTERIKCYLLNSLCRLFYQREYQKFIRIKDLKKQQSVKLLTVLRKNETCVYGKKFGFHKIKNITEYQKAVPLTTYEDYLPFIEKIKNGEQNILTSEPVLLLEPTGGSTSATKLIPYTKSLQVEFQKGIKPWLYDLYTQNPELNWGKSYWSITPATMPKKYTKGGLPIGFAEDSEYLGGLGKRLLKHVLVVPDEIVQEKNMANFYKKTALALLKCRNLIFISIWNPSLLILILKYIEENLAELLLDLPWSRRTEAEKYSEAKAYDKLWPYLKVISCWGDAHAHLYFQKLQGLFPQVYLQPKGLLATEGFVSFPLTGEKGARLSLNSHFFEFISPKNKQIYLAHELTPGQEYEVVITTSGGLYRYQLNDLIEVIGFQGPFPLLKFKGKGDKVCDLFGEKLHEDFLKNIMDSLGLKDVFYMFAPEKNGYVLYIQTEQSIPHNLDEMLRTNFHYDYCRKLGQLQAVKVFKLTGDPLQEYLRECVRRGQKLGDIKPTVLHLESGWDQVFTGSYIREGT